MALSVLLAGVLLLLLGACTLEAHQEEAGNALSGLLLRPWEDEAPGGGGLRLPGRHRGGNSRPDGRPAHRSVGAGLSSPIPAVGQPAVLVPGEADSFHLDLSEQYGGLYGDGPDDGGQLYHPDLLRLEWVESVYITVEGGKSTTAAPSAHRSGHFLSGARKSRFYLASTLVPAAGERGWVVEYRSILKEEGAVRPRPAGRWRRGPSNDSRFPCVREGTHVHSAWCGGVCTVDLSGSLSKTPRGPPGGRGLIYAW